MTPIELLAPIEMSTFLDDYWETKHFHIGRSDASFYQNILTLDDLAEYLSRNDIRYPSLRLIKQGKPVPLSEFSSQLRFGRYEADGLIDVDKVYELHRAGASIVLQLMRSSMDKLSLFSNKLHAQFGFNIEATIYVTPPNEQGFTTHFDTHSVLVLQISGKKQWKLYDFPKRYPLLDETFDKFDYAQVPPVDDLVLSPGDLLYVPRGQAHDARATGDTSSIHITIGLFPLMWRDLFDDYIKGLKREVRFRRAPIGFFASDHVQSFGAEWNELSKFVLADATIEHLWMQSSKAHIARQSRMTHGRISEIEHITSLTLETVVRLRKGLVLQVEYSVDRIYMRVYEKTLSLPSHVAPGIKMLTTGEPLRVEEIQRTLDPMSRIALVKKLIGEGIAEVI